MERLSQLSPSNRTINSPLSLASDYAKASFFLCDADDNLIGYSYWPKTNAVNFSDVLTQFNDNHAGKYRTAEKKWSPLSLLSPPFYQQRRRPPFSVSREQK